MIKNLGDLSIRVRFLVEWMGNPVGSEKELWEYVAKMLKERGTVEFIPKEEQEKKSFRRPLKDKMVKESVNK